MVGVQDRIARDGIVLVLLSIEVSDAYTLV